MSDELRTVRKANVALSKRRKAKKTRVRHGGAATVGDVQDQITQQEVEEQLGRESLENRGRSRGGATREKAL